MNVIAFDDGPFERMHRGNVVLIGAVCSRTRLDGVVAGRIRRDGTDSTRQMIALVRNSQFRAHIRTVMLQGIAVAGFNVVDVHLLAEELGVPVLVVARHRPDLGAVKRALFSGDPPSRPRVIGARRKWQLIERAGAIEELRVSPRQRLWVQRVGLPLDAARDLVRGTTLHGNIPEPLRVAHLIAGGVVTGASRGRA